MANPKLEELQRDSDEAQWQALELSLLEKETVDKLNHIRELMPHALRKCFKTRIEYLKARSGVSPKDSSEKKEEV